MSERKKFAVSSELFESMRRMGFDVSMLIVASQKKFKGGASYGEQKEK